METEAVARIDNGVSAMSVKQVTDRVNLVHQVLEKVMKKATHYGTVPGCGAKMVLLKPGADVLAMTFRLVPQFKVERTDLPDGHKEYDVTCSMFSPSGELLGQGVGSASTMEKKYRYRKDERGNRQENEDIADVYNTVLKIAKKRAHIDATLTVTGAADIFTQDLIDEDEPQKEPIKMPTEKTAAKPDAKADEKTEPTEGVLVMSGVVKAVSVKPTGSKKPHGVCIVTDAGEVWLNTFHETPVDAAQQLKGHMATVEYTEGKFGKDLVSIKTQEPAQ